MVHLGNMGFHLNDVGDWRMNTISLTKQLFGDNTTPNTNFILRPTNGFLMYFSCMYG